MKIIGIVFFNNYLASLPQKESERSNKFHNISGVLILMNLDHKT